MQIRELNSMKFCNYFDAKEHQKHCRDIKKWLNEYQQNILDVTRQIKHTYPQFDPQWLLPKQSIQAIEGNKFNNHNTPYTRQCSPDFILLTQEDRTLILPEFSQLQLLVPYLFMQKADNKGLFMEIMQQRNKNIVISRQYKHKIINTFTLVLNIFSHPYSFWQKFHIKSAYKDPFTDYEEFFPLKINNLLILMSIINSIWQLTANIAIFSSFSEPRSRRIHRYFGNNTIFNLFKFKCIFRQQPILSVSFVWLLSTVFFSFALNILEHNIPSISNKFKYYENCVWFTIVTTTSVGFGDVKPLSHYGYILSFICSVFGTFIMSLILIIAILNLRLDQKENETIKYLVIEKQRLIYQQLARLYIRERLWRLWINFKLKKQEIQARTERILKRKLKAIKILIDKKENNLEQDCCILRQLESIAFSINCLKDNNLKILNFISGSMFFKKNTINKDIKYSKSELNQSKSLISISQRFRHYKVQDSQPQIMINFVKFSHILNQSR